jgi:hypothetical protein
MYVRILPSTIAFGYYHQVTLSECPGLENAGLVKLVRFEKLSQLALTNDEDRSLDFFEGVLPILQVRGRQLLNLILTDFLVVDLDRE